MPDGVAGYGSPEVKLNSYKHLKVKNRWG